MPEIDARAAGRERGAQRVVVADAAGQLDGDVEPADDGREQLTVVAATERGVEVDEVDPLGAVALPGERRLERIAVVGLGARRALDEPHGRSPGDVDRGQQDEELIAFLRSVLSITSTGAVITNSSSTPITAVTLLVMT